MCFLSAFRPMFFLCWLLHFARSHRHFDIDAFLCLLPFVSVFSMKSERKDSIAPEKKEIRSEACEAWKNKVNFSSAWFEKRGLCFPYGLVNLPLFCSHFCTEIEHFMLVFFSTELFFTNWKATRKTVPK